MFQLIHKSLTVLIRVVEFWLSIFLRMDMFFVARTAATKMMRPLWFEPRC